MNNVQGTSEVSLSVFGGLNSELAPSDLPMGLSPDCCDVAFLPGQVFTRPSLERVASVATAGTIIYHHDYIKPDGSVTRMMFDSLGGMYAGDAKIGQTAAGNRFHCANAFGRCFIAVSDGLHGADVPLQYTENGNLDRVTQDGPALPPLITNVTLPAVALSGNLNRAGGVVSATTAAPHGLNVGDQVTVTGVADAALAVSSIVANNELNPGVLTITTGAAHGFTPGETVTVLGVQPSAIGGGVASWMIQNNQVTFVTVQAHGLLPGAQILESTQGLAVREHLVSATPNPTTLTCDTTGSNASGTNNATLTLPFPAPSGQAFNVATVTSATSFQVPATVSDGSWSTGTVNFPWDGVFFVTTTGSPATLTYAQNGPDGSTAAGGGMAQPQGQIAAGSHTCWLIFRTRNGSLTAPSPPVKFNAPGNGSIRVDQVATGPANVVARWLAFSGANGAEGFVLPVPPQVNSQIVGTSSVIGDNTTTSAIFNFSDQSLYGGLGIGISGNNLFRQRVLDGALGFYSYQGRLLTWGQRNKVVRLLNMGFEGGTVVANQPAGWTIAGTGVLGASMDYGLAWTPTGGATISQAAFQDQYGVAILSPLTQYTFRAWVNGTVTAQIVSASAGVLATATVTANGAFAQADFSAKMPAVIPADARLQLSGGTMDELSILYTANPYLLGVATSYIINPEGFDGDTGILGPDDPQPVRGVYRKRDVLSLITAAPHGSRYEVESSPSGEPVTWALRRMSTECGAYSVWGNASSEDWECWASETGLRIDAGETEKLSQEVQTFWDSINPAARHLTVVSNDSYTRRMYILAATGAAMATNTTMVLDYRELNTAGALANSGTLRVGYGGKVFTTDLTRKWTPWTVQATYCGMLTVGGASRMVFAGGSPGAIHGLREGQYSGVDEDFGPFWQHCRYSTYFFVDTDEAEQKHLGSHRLLHTFLTANMGGRGSVFYAPFPERLDNAKGVTRALTVNDDLARDLEFPLNIAGERISYMLRCQPAGPQPAAAYATAAFRVSLMTVAMRDHPYSPIRGRNG